MAKIEMKPMNYSPKIILAWGEAISGNSEIRNWLIENDFQELGLFVFAMHHNEEAREWLMKNGYPHLAAMLNGVEGNVGAIQWLAKFGFSVLEKMALAGDGDIDAYQWLVKSDYREFALVAKKIEFVKDEIEANHNDPHKISKV